MSLKYEPGQTGGEHVEREAHRHRQCQVEVVEADIGHDVGEGRRNVVPKGQPLDHLSGPMPGSKEIKPEKYN